MNVKLIKDADSGELYMLPNEEEAVKQTPLFVQENVFPEIRIRTEDYDANSIIADLNKQLDAKVKAEQTDIAKVEDVGFVCTKDEIVTEEKYKPNVDKVAVGCLIAMLAILGFCVSTFFMSDETINKMNTTVEQAITFEDNINNVSEENVVGIETVQESTTVNASSVENGVTISEGLKSEADNTLETVFSVLVRIAMFLSVVLSLLYALEFLISWILKW